VSERVAIVTGAGRGIGRAAADALAAAGARVMAVSRSEAELAATGHDHLKADLSQPEECARVVEETRRRLGPISILVNNAGVGAYHERPIWEQTAEVWRESLAVNLDAPFHLTRLAAPDMMAAGWGRIVMVSSTAGEVGAPSIAAYSAGKAGLLGLMRSVAQDLIPHGITCNAVLPGWVRTEMADADAATEAERRGLTADQVWAERAAGYAAGRVLVPDEIASVVAFLCSDAAGGLNGEEITVSLGSVW
jgi:3-hydroxybutyrate dehydrogenase